jgi:hypothetical protein
MKELGLNKKLVIFEGASKTFKTSIIKEINESSELNAFFFKLKKRVRWGQTYFNMNINSPDLSTFLEGMNVGSLEALLYTDYDYILIDRMHISQYVYDKLYRRMNYTLQSFKLFEDHLINIYGLSNIRMIYLRDNVSGIKSRLEKEDINESEQLQDVLDRFEEAFTFTRFAYKRIEASSFDELEFYVQQVKEFINE